MLTCFTLKHSELKVAEFPPSLCPFPPYEA
jgi:hypothetical protein